MRSIASRFGINTNTFNNDKEDIIAFKRYLPENECDFVDYVIKQKGVGMNTLKTMLALQQKSLNGHFQSLTPQK